MVDNTSAFHSSEYDRKIRQTFPYYEDFFAQVIELVETVHAGPVSWLGCGTGMMGSAAFGNIPLERFVFMDSSEGMIAKARERFRFPNAEFSVSDVRDLQYENEFDVITAIQVFHFLQAEERRTVLRQCHAALKENGILVSFENIAPFTETGKTVCPGGDRRTYFPLRKRLFPDYNRGASASSAGKRLPGRRNAVVFKYAGRLLGHEIRSLFSPAGHNG